MSARGLVIALVALAGVVAWYLFRPERAFVDDVVDEEVPGVAVGAAVGPASAAADEPSPVLSGRFQGVAHEAEGVAAVYATGEGALVLRFSDFDVSNGPDLYVYLVAAEDAPDDATVERSSFISVARLKGNVGDQNYELPAEVDVSTYRTVVIWCRRFGVNFAAAPLRPPPA